MELLPLFVDHFLWQTVFFTPMSVFKTICPVTFLPWVAQDGEKLRTRSLSFGRPFNRSETLVM